MGKILSQRTIFVGNLSINSKRHDLDKYFSKFGKIRDIEINEKKGTAFIKFEDPDSAKHAVDEMDGRNYEGARVKVDFKHQYLTGNKLGDFSGVGSGKSGPKPDDICYSCGKRGHWSKQCEYYTNFKNKCYRCGKTGHLKKDCSRHSSSFSSRSSSSQSVKSKRSSSSNSSQSSKKQRKQRKYKSDSEKSRSSSHSRSRSRSNSKSKSASKSRSVSKSKSKSSNSSSK